MLRDSALRKSSIDIILLLVCVSAHAMWYEVLCGRVDDQEQGRTGPPGSFAFARWARWSAGHLGRHVKCWRRSNDLCLAIYPANRRRAGRYGRQREEGQIHKQEEREGWFGTGTEVAWEGELYLDIFVQGSPEFLRHFWWGRPAYLARAGLKSQSASDREWLWLALLRGWSRTTPTIWWR